MTLSGLRGFGFGRSSSRKQSGRDKNSGDKSKNLWLSLQAKTICCSYQAFEHLPFYIGLVSNKIDR